MKTITLLIVTILSVSAFAQNPSAPAKMPNDVVSLVSRIRDCAHWSGEEPYDKDRASQIAIAMKTLRCDQLEKDEASIRLKYKANKDVLETIDQAKKLPY
ncbi:MAG: hypothetical protein K0R29_723 [Pseudobdellovibrio sp.]|jgi:hypothetical protein|nr:hypothetical protein [Pseudobdellovibrio sp.]